MTISLPKDIKTRLIEEAKRQGVNVETYVATLLTSATSKTPATNPSNSLSELFEKWRQEQATNDPAEIDRRTQDEAEFMQAMNRNRVEMEGPDARKIYS